MTVNILSTDPKWSFEPSVAEAKFAALMKAHGVTTEGGKATLIANITTLAQAIEVCQGLLGCFVVTP